MGEHYLPLGDIYSHCFPLFHRLLLVTANGMGQNGWEGKGMDMGGRGNGLLLNLGCELCCESEDTTSTTKVIGLQGDNNTALSTP